MYTCHVNKMIRVYKNTSVIFRYLQDIYAKSCCSPDKKPHHRPPHGEGKIRQVPPARESYAAGQPQEKLTAAPPHDTKNAKSGHRPSVGKCFWRSSAQNENGDAPGKKIADTSGSKRTRPLSKKTPAPPSSPGTTRGQTPQRKAPSTPLPSTTRKNRQGI